MILASLGVFLDGNTLAVYATRRKFGSKPFSAGEVFTLGSDPFLTAESPQEVAGFLRQFCDRYTIKPTSMTFGVSRSKYFWSLVEMPPVSRQDLFKLFQYEVEMHVPASSDAIVYDVKPLESTDTANSRVTLVSTSKQIVERLSGIASETGFQLHLIEPAMAAIQRIVLASGQGSDGTSAILIQNGTRCELGILKSGALVALRVMTCGGDDPDEQKHVIDECRLALLSLNANASFQSCSHLFLAGDFSQEWKQRIKELWPETDVSDLRDTESTPIACQAGPLLCARGHSLAQSSDPADLLNLLPPDRRPVHRHTGLVLTGVFTGVLLASSLLMMANSFWNTQYESTKISRQIGTMEGRVQEILDINKQYSAVRKEFEFLRSISRDYPSQLEILREITRVMPATDTEAFKKVWLESYARNEAQITLVGQSESPEGLITILEDSDYFEKVRFDGNVAGQKFTIKAMLSRISRQDIRNAEESETGRDDSDSETKPGTDPGDSSDKTSVPANGKNENGKERDKAKPGTREDSPGSDSHSRGPAFPREPARTAPMDSATQQDSDASSPESAPAAPEEKSPEDIEKMKNNLFEFIKKHKEEGNVVERDRSAVEPDSEEAAANFLEFLKSAANEQNTEQHDSSEGN